MESVFISYSSHDADFAELTKMKLDEIGVRVWIDQDGLRVGEDWRTAIDSGIEASDALIVILTPESCRSTYVTYEWAFAHGQGKQIIPLLLRATEIHPRLEAFQYIDFTNRNSRPWETLFQELGYTRNDRAITEPVDAYVVAGNQILDYMMRKGFNLVSFGRIRDSIDPNYDDDFLFEVIRQNHSRFRAARLKGGRQGLARN